MDSMQNHPSLRNPRELKGVLVYDAVMRRCEIARSNPKRTPSVQPCDQGMNQVIK